MEKEHNIKSKEKENESEEDDEEVLTKKRINKLNITPEQIKSQYDEYLNCKLMYPKSQFCFFYFKGTCLLGNKCQFCHGYQEFSLERYLTFLKDETAVEKSSQKYYQKFYFNQLISEDEYTYDNLLEYQEKHPDEFKKKFTFEELKASRKKRLVIRKALTQSLIDNFLKDLFDKFNVIKSEDLNYYIFNSGYTLSIKKLLKNTKICFSKTIKESNNNNIYYIKSLSKEEMLNIFIKKSIEYMNKGKYEDFFPINISKISKIIFTSMDKYEPNLTVYKSQTNINEKDFINIYIEKLMDECNKGNFDLIKNKTKDELLGDKDINYIIDLKNNLSNLNINKFCFFNLDDLFKIDKAQDRNKLQFQLFNEGYLFFINNDNKLLAFNYNKFNSFDIDDFYNNNYYYKNCFKTLDIENKIENINLNENNEILELSQKNIFKIENTLIKFINDENSLKYFNYKSKNFETLSLDLEGVFDSSYENIKINLIQICDDTNLKNDIYIIDFYTLKNISIEIFSELSSILKDIFENKFIKKIFFDGRSDLLCLHKELNICTKNFIDLSSLYNAVNSYNKQYELKISNKEKNEKDFKQCFNTCKQNFYSKGLNTILKEYHSKNCFNPLKDKYHKLFKEKNFDYWTQRPIIEEFLLYSARDVKYEFDTYHNLKIKLKKLLEDFYEMNDISHDNIDLIILLISCSNHNVACDKYINIINNINKEKTK